MSELKATCFALIAALTVPQWTGAQVASKVEAGALSTQSAEQAIPSSIFRLAPALRIEGKHYALAAKGAAWLHGQRWQVADGIVSGTFVSPTIYGVRAEMIGNASRAFEDRSLGTDQIDVQTRIHLLYKQRGGAWLGGGIARPWRVAAVTNVDLAGGGLWTRLGSATINSNLTSYRFTKAEVRDSTAVVRCGNEARTAGVRVRYLTADATSCKRQARVSDIEAGFKWDVRGIEVSALAGHRAGRASEIGRESRNWAMGTATIWVAPRVAFVAAGGRQPANLQRSLPARTFGSVGMVLAYWPIPKGSIPVAPARSVALKSFEVKPAPNGQQKFNVTVGGVESVEIMGDFSDWVPVPLKRRGRNQWELSLPLGPGVHQLSIRVDGGDWMPPPGLPIRRSGFGEVGQLVVVK